MTMSLLGNRTHEMLVGLCCVCSKGTKQVPLFPTKSPFLDFSVIAKPSNPGPTSLYTHSRKALFNGAMFDLFIVSKQQHF